MDWKKSLFAALKGALYVVIGSLLAAFASPDWNAALGAIGDALAGAVPVVGGLLGGVVKNLLLVGTAALVAWLNNLRKNIGS